MYGAPSLMDPFAPQISDVSLRVCPACRAVYRAEFSRCPTDGDLLEVTEVDPLIGTTLGEHYVIDKWVGEGGIARVYRAHHRRLEHRVFAVKVMLGDWATTMSMRMRFAQEAETASRLEHPNVVPVVDFGRTEQGLLYLAMEFVEGRSLAKIIDDDGPLAADRAIALARQMCLGLAYAHEQGLVHRDFKPDNVLVVETARGEVARIADFGLAISEDRDRDVRLTAVGIAVGTPVYAAPEQTSNDCEVDHRADLFSLGVTLYEMLAGKLPFDGNIVELLRRNAAGDPPRISQRSGVRVPAALEEIVRTLMAPDPTLRFASALAVVAALDRVHESELVSVAPTPPSRPLRSRRIVLGLVGAALVAGLALAISVLRAPTTAPPALARAEVLFPRRIEEPSSPLPPTSAVTVASGPSAGEPAPVLPSVSAMKVAAVKPPVANRRRAGDVSATTKRNRPPPPTQIIEAPARPTLERAAVAEVPQSGPDPLPAQPITRVEPVTLPVPAPRPGALGRPTVELTRLSVQGALASSVVRRTLGRVEPQIAACYAKGTGAVIADAVPITLVIDESGGVGRVQLGAGASASAASCVAEVLHRARTLSPPDVGTVHVSFTLVMRRVPQ